MWLQILDDPAGNSFLQGTLNEVDSQLTVTHYQRSPEQDQQLMVGRGSEIMGGTDAVVSRCMLGVLHFGTLYEKRGPRRKGTEMETLPGRSAAMRL